jgi:hypothetical protein
MPKDRTDCWRRTSSSEGQATGSADLTRCAPNGFRGRLSPRVERNARVFLHDVDTERGQSGCPLWLRDDNTLTLAGIHYGEITLPDGQVRNVGVMITQEVADQVRDWIRNFVERH